MSGKTVKDFIVGVFFILLEVLIFQHLSLFGVHPDPLLLYLLWLALRYDRVQLLLFAAALGLIQDALFDFWGLYMFSKVLLSFAFYHVINRQTEGRLLLWQIFIITGIASLIHNIIFIGLGNFIQAYNTSFAPILYIFGKSLYTAVLGTILFIFKGE